MTEAAAPPRSNTRRRAVEFGIGIACGFVISSLLGPGVIGWWYEPPSGDTFSCAAAVRAAISQFVVFQLVTAGAGGGLLLLGSFWVRRRLRREPGSGAPA